MGNYFIRINKIKRNYLFWNIEENKRNKKYWVFKLLGLDVVSKEWGCKRSKDMFWNSSYFFLIIHDNTEVGILGSRALKVRRTKNEEHRSKSSKLLIDKVRGATTRFTFVYGFMYG